MANSTRLLGRYLEACSLTPEGGSAVDVKEYVTDIRIRYNADMDDVTPLRDYHKYPFVTAVSWEMEIQMIITPATTGSAIASLLDALRQNKQVTVSVSWKPPTGTSKYDKYNGAGMATWDMTSPKGTGIVTLRIVGQGELVRTAGS